MDYNAVFRERTKNLALEIIRATAIWPFSDGFSVIRRQIIRAVTSVAANYRAVCKARSDKEKFAKLCIVVEEADETLFWLELIEELCYLEAGKTQFLKAEATEIISVMAAYKKSLQR